MNQSIKVPESYARQKEEAIREKLEKADKALQEFLEKENLVILPRLDYLPNQIVPSFQCVPKEFLKFKEDTNLS